MAAASRFSLQQYEGLSHEELAVAFGAVLTFTLLAVWLSDSQASFIFIYFKTTLAGQENAGKLEYG